MREWRNETHRCRLASLATGGLKLLCASTAASVRRTSLPADLHHPPSAPRGRAGGHRPFWPARHYSSGRHSPRPGAHRAAYHHKALATSVIQGLIVLRALADSEPHTAAEVAASLDTSENTVYRYIRTLATAGLLGQDATTRLYRLTPLRDRTSPSPDSVAA